MNRFIFSPSLLGSIFFSLCVGVFSSFANSDILIYEADHQNRAIIHGNDTEDITLYFGDSFAQALEWSGSNNYFQFSHNVNFTGNEIQDVRLENLSLPPVCDASTTGKIYFNTTDSREYICDGTAWINSARNPKVFFSNTLPTIAGGEQEGDMYFITNDGTSNGEVLEEWIFDGSTWVLKNNPLGGISAFSADTGQQINIANTIISFDNTISNDANVTFGGNQFTINNPGTYQIIFNGRMFSSRARTAPTFELYKNGVGQNIFTTNSYIRANSGHNHTGVNLAWNMNLEEGDIIDLRTIVDGAGSTSTIIWAENGEANIQFMRVR